MTFCTRVGRSTTELQETRGSHHLFPHIELTLNYFYFSVPVVIMTIIPTNIFSIYCNYFKSFQSLIAFYISLRSY